MILSDHTIRERLHELVDDPGRIDNGQIQPASLDISIEGTLRDWRTDEALDTLVTQPFGFYHAYSTEYLKLPNDLAAQMTGRSSIGRNGVNIHITAGWFDPGFRGYAKYEIFNCSPVAFEFDPGQRVAQMVFTPTDHPTDGYDGQFQGQRPGDR